MSTAMMSAPSWASRMAWLRPCPRAAPVMKATFPSSFPMLRPPCLSGLAVRCAGPFLVAEHAGHAFPPVGDLGPPLLGGTCVEDRQVAAHLGDEEAGSAGRG